jgi:hypothetical protein
MEKFRTSRRNKKTIDSFRSPDIGNGKSRKLFRFGSQQGSQRVKMVG